MALTYSEKLEIGSPPVDFSLKGTDEGVYSLSQLSNKKALLIVFTCNHCPYAKASWPTLIELSKKYPDVQFVAINPNDSDAYPEDSYDGMKKEVDSRQIPFPYLHDEDQSVARSYKAQCTPDPYLYKNDEGTLKLFYHGRINDNWQNPESVSDHSLENAINKVLNNEDPESEQNPSMGCSIKWKS